MIPAVGNADLVIHDAFFEVGRYAARADWGHSTARHALRLCRDAGARQLYLLHFAPDLEDLAVDGMVGETREMAGPIDVPAAVVGWRSSSPHEIAASGLIRDVE